jgi:hypothetical protein
MYLTRNRRKVLFVDELKQQLGDIGADDPVKAAVIEEAARRARKYGGALGTATQSADDFYGSTQMEAAFNCSDWVFLLRQKPESIEMLDRKGRLTMDEPKKRLLNSLRTEAGVFSELYISSPVGEGVARNILDPATHLLFSNNWKTTPRSTNCALMACPSTRRSASCCAIGDIRYEAEYIPVIAPGLADAIRGERRPDRLRPSRSAPCAGHRRG